MRFDHSILLILFFSIEFGVGSHPPHPAQTAPFPALGHLRDSLGPLHWYYIMHRSHLDPHRPGTRAKRDSWLINLPNRTRLTLHFRFKLDRGPGLCYDGAIKLYLRLIMLPTNPVSPAFDADQFKAEVEHHIATGWVGLPLDQKLFICRYIKDGHSIVPMTTMEYGSVPLDEAQAYIRDPMTQAAIADVSKRYAEITTFTKTGLQARLARALDMALGEVPQPTYDKKGELKMVRRVDHSAIAKYLTMAQEIASMEDDDKIDESSPWAED